MRAPREILERRLPVQVRHYAFPYGDANEAVLDVLARQQYQLAVTVNPGGNAFFAQPLMLRRTMIFGDVGLDAFKAKVQTSRPIGRAANPRGIRSVSATVSDDRVAPPASLPAPATAFEQRLRERALGQAREGRWAEAGHVVGDPGGPAAGRGRLPRPPRRDAPHDRSRRARNAAARAAGPQAR